MDSVTDNITAIDEQVRPLLATKRRLQVLEEDLKLERALAGRHHSYLQQLVLEVSGHPMPLPSGSVTGQPTSDRTHRELHVEEFAAKDRSRSPQSGTGTGNVTMMPIRSGHRDGHASIHGTVTERSHAGHGTVTGRSRGGFSSQTLAHVDEVFRGF